MRKKAVGSPSRRLKGKRHAKTSTRSISCNKGTAKLPGISKDTESDLADITLYLNKVKAICNKPGMTDMQKAEALTTPLRIIRAIVNDAIRLLESDNSISYFNNVFARRL